MDVVEFLNKKVEIPACWNDFTRGQVELISKELSRPRQLSAFRATLMANILALKGHTWNFGGKTYYTKTRNRYWAFRQIAARKAWLIDPEDFFHVSELLNWMFDVVEGEDKLRFAERKVNLTTNHWPAIRVGWHRVYGPATGFGNVCTAEFIRAEVEYEQFIANANEHNLNKLCAALYRPRKRFYRMRRWLQLTEKDRRQEFNTDLVDLHTRWQRVPVWQRFAIMLLFEGQRNEYIETFDLVYQPADPDDANDPSDGPTGWPAIIRVMAGHVINIEQVARVPIYNFLFDLNERIREMRKSKIKK